VDTITDNDAKPEEATVSLEIAQQVRAFLASLVKKIPPVPPLLEGLPLELWLERIVPIALAAELMGGLTSETVLKKYRDKLIQLDGRKFGSACVMRCCWGARKRPHPYRVRPQLFPKTTRD
jgi:hypothetical protein